MRDQADLNRVASRNENKGRAEINQLNIQPKLNVALPDDWFATAFASENIQINYGDDGKVFFPFDLMVGKKLLQDFVASLEFSREIVHNKGFEPYQWQPRRAHRILLLNDFWSKNGIQWVKYTIMTNTD